MRRSPELEPFSHDHHQALVLARHARRTAESGENLAEVVAEIRERFSTELEPHFRVEEERLAPAMAEAGEKEMADRLFAEHEELRAFLKIAEPGPKEIADFGVLLHDHVRWEERELFPRAQEILSLTQLQYIHAGCIEAGLGKPSP